jgi:hypothetical protein
MAARDARPVVALDFDGVLNAITSHLAPDRQLHTVNIPAEHWPDSLFLSQPRPGENVLRAQFRLRPADGPWITHLRQHAEVVWAITWEEAANEFIAPLLGIEPLPLGVNRHEHPPRFGYVKTGDSAGWKLSALRENTGDGRLCGSTTIIGTTRLAAGGSSGPTRRLG